MKRMREVAAVAVMGAMALAAGAQTSATVKDDLFNGTEIFAKNATDVNEITMDPGTLGMVDGKDSKRAHNMVLSVVRTYSYDKPGMYRIEDVDAFRNKLNTGEWHCSVHTRSLKTGESTDVCNKQRSDDMKETAIITVEPKQLTFIHTIGKSGSASWPGSSAGSWSSGPEMSFLVPGMGGMAPAMQAEMALGRAQMQVGLAEMRTMAPQMALGMAKLHTLDMPRLQAQVDQAMQSLPQIDSAAMQKKLDEAFNDLNATEKQRTEKRAE